MDDSLNNIHHGDCVAGMNALAAGSVDLAFADPPFNIGYEYDVYEDRRGREQYLAWSRQWIEAVHAVLKPSGTFWLAIGDEYAAELKVASQEIGFYPRSWVIWYYTFGVNCKRKFTRSHAHLFYFVKDPQQFTFRDDDLDNRIPSARQLVYQDKRSNPRGRLPDDTWIIRPADVVGELLDDEGMWSPSELAAPSDDDRTFTLRPQDLGACFTPAEDTWYFPRVAGTFKERAGFHGCQMPEQLLGRIIRCCSNEGDVVLDPFSGSATTLAVAKKLGRKYIGFDLSPDYIKQGRTRLESIRVGDRLDGSPEPLLSAPKSSESRIQGVRRPKDNTEAIKDSDRAAVEARYDEVQLQLTLQGIIAAFRLTHDGFSPDRVVADPERNKLFTDCCDQLGLVGEARTWNTLLFRLRKAGKLAHINTTRRTSFSWDHCDNFIFASEIAWKQLEDEKAVSLDEILCDPNLAVEFDAIARRFAPEYLALEYRWAALKIRKRASEAVSHATVLKAPSRLGRMLEIDKLRPKDIPEMPGVYLVNARNAHRVYAGGAVNLRSRLSRKFAGRQKREWRNHFDDLTIQIFPVQTKPSEVLSWQSCFVSKYHPEMNLDLTEIRHG